MKDTAKVTFAINIDATKRTVEVIGNTIIDGQQVKDYHKNIEERESENDGTGVVIEDVIKLLIAPLELDKRFGNYNLIHTK